MKTKLLGPVFSRRSIRKYTLEPVSDSDIELMLRAAMSAPSAVAKDPWRFVVIDDASQKERIAEALPHGKFIAEAPIGIAVCGDISAAHSSLEGYLIQDCSAAIENLLIAANMLGLGACWLGVYPRQERMSALKEILNLPKDIIPVACISVGHPAEKKEPRDRYNKNYVYKNSWK